VGPRGLAKACQLGLSPHDALPVDSNGLRRCVGGELVHENELERLPFAFPQRLAAAGIGALVAAPLAIETKVFGVLLVTRGSDDFTSSECEFLRQLSEHVALAAHQAQMYDALQRAYNDLRQSQQTAIQQERLRALGQMASGIAHDINNALSPVVVYADVLLEREPLSPQAREFMETIQRAVGDAAQTVARMSEFYRQREPQLVLKPVDLNELVPQVLNLTRARWSDMAQQRGIEIITRSDLCTDLPSIDGVESEIREALVNLIFNAVDAMPDGGVLSVRTGTQRPRGGPHESRRVYVEVQDTGVGMDQDTRERCLEPFFTTKGDRGTGLGLSMVFGTARRHEAEVDIDSAPRQGARVRLTFPGATRPQTVQARDEPQRIPPLRILLVDDDTLILRSLKAMLEGDGHRVVAAPGGEDGIRVWNEEPSGYDIVITDLGMPRTDGRRVAAAVKERRPATPVLMLTGWGRGMVADGIPHHVDRLLSKPPKLLEVRAALAELTLDPAAASTPYRA
ncbi:MAG TPA: response regulator, partial [Polyangiales bacterium]